MKTITEVRAYEGNAIEYTGDDGYPKGYIMPVVEVDCEDGTSWFLPNSFKTEYDDEGYGPYVVVRFDLTKAREIAETIYKDRGFINEENWVEFTPDVMSIEDSFDAAWLREREERFGCGN